MQLDLFAMFAEVESRPKVQQPVHECSVVEFRACQEIERDLYNGRGAWLYKQLEREMARQAQAAREVEKVLAEGWR